MNTVYIYHHLGLGDHIIANGLVRTIAKDYDVVFLFCKPHNIKNVSYMYRDLTKLKLLPFEDDGVAEFMKINSHHKYIIIGHSEFSKIFNSPGNKLTIDEIFYSLAGLSIEKKWEAFYVDRDIKREKEVFERLGLEKGEKYIFVHDKEDAKIYKNLPDTKIIKPKPEFSLFDFLYTIENANEIHCINSSFSCLIDCIGIDKENMFIHTYPQRQYDDFLNGKLRNNWKLIR